MTLPTHPNDQKESRFRDYVLTIQWLLRDCSSHLTTNETHVALFVADRTLGWGKTSEIITRRHFLEGIQDSESGVWYAGALPMSKNTLSAAINSLIDKGLVVSKKVRLLTSYSLNLVWSNTITTQLTNDMGLATPKRLQTLQTTQTGGITPSLTENESSRQGQKLTPSGSKIDPMQGQKLTPKKSKEKNSKEKNAFPTEKRESNSLLNNELEPSLEERLSSATDNSRSARSIRLSKWTSATAFAIWTDLEKKHHSGITHFTTTKSNRFALLQYGKKWIAANRSTENWMTYLEWCIGNWSIIQSEKLSWMVDAPTQPCMPFFVRNSARFEQAYEERATFDALSKMSIRDREVERRVNKGVPRNVAEKEVDDRDGLTKERERLERAASVIKNADIAAYGRDREAEATARRKQRWVDAEKLTAPAAKGTFDEWQ